jgi:nicotinamide mononucleotide transporter
VESLAGAINSVSPWELAAVLLAAGYLLLAVKENIWCWYCAFVSTALYSVLFWDVSLLMQSALNAYYMGMAVFGWYQWKRGALLRSGEHQGISISTWPAARHLLIIGGIIALTGASGYLLSGSGYSAWPYLDSFTTWASVITTWMVARKILENWLYWIVIDAVSIPLYLDRDLTLTALLFVGYLVIAIIGFFSWRTHYQREQVACEH